MAEWTDQGEDRLRSLPARPEPSVAALRTTDEERTNHFRGKSGGLADRQELVGAGCGHALNVQVVRFLLKKGGDAVDDFIQRSEGAEAGEGLEVRSFTLRARSSIVISSVLPTLMTSPMERSVSMRRTRLSTVSRTSQKQRDCLPVP